MINDDLRIETKMTLSGHIRCLFKLIWLSRSSRMINDKVIIYIFRNRVRLYLLWPHE
jgi:hypothetical protein